MTLIISSANLRTLTLPTYRAADSVVVTADALPFIAALFPPRDNVRVHGSPDHAATVRHARKLTASMITDDAASLLDPSLFATPDRAVTPVKATDSGVPADIRARLARVLYAPEWSLITDGVAARRVASGPSGLRYGRVSA